MSYLERIQFFIGHFARHVLNWTCNSEDQNVRTESTEEFMDMPMSKKALNVARPSVSEPL